MLENTKIMQKRVTSQTKHCTNYYKIIRKHIQILQKQNHTQIIENFDKSFTNIVQNLVQIH